MSGFVFPLAELVKQANEAAKEHLRKKRELMEHNAGIETLKKFGVEVPKNER